ncbi:hypothetical protein AAG906_035271 [Vitis piasezkii]
MIDRCSLFYSKRSDSNKIMKSCGHKCQHQALLKVGTLKANKQPQDELMRHLSSGTQSSPLATAHDGLRRKKTRQKVMFFRYDVSPIGTLSTRHGRATMHIRNPEGPSRSPSCSSYVRMTLSAAKAVGSWAPNDSSFIRLYQLAVG